MDAFRGWVVYMPGGIYTLKRIDDEDIVQQEKIYKLLVFVFDHEDFFLVFFHHILFPGNFFQRKRVDADIFHVQPGFVDLISVIPAGGL
jgi:hypothetical protein